MAANQGGGAVDEAGLQQPLVPTIGIYGRGGGCAEAVEDPPLQTPAEVPLPRARALRDAGEAASAGAAEDEASSSHSSGSGEKTAGAVVASRPCEAGVIDNGAKEAVTCSAREERVPDWRRPQGARGSDGADSATLALAQHELRVAEGEVWQWLVPAFFFSCLASTQPHHE